MHQGSLAPVTRQAFEAHIREVEAAMRRLRFEVERLKDRVDELEANAKAG